MTEKKPAKDGEVTEMLQYIVRNMATKDDVQRVDSKVAKLEQSMGSVEQRMGAVEQRMGSVEERIGAVEQRMGSVEISIDKFVGKVETEKSERTALHHKVDRHEGYIQQLASNAKLTLQEA